MLIESLHPSARVLASDEFICAVEKPSGVATHPDRSSATSKSALIWAPYNFSRESYRLENREAFLVHRLDKDTSGVLILSFQKKIAEALKALFAEHKIQKEYAAWVCGYPSSPKGTWSDCVETRRSRGSPRVTIVRGKPNCFTDYEIYEKTANGAFSLLMLRPKTGRTHQLRVQAARRRHFILGDSKYGWFQLNRDIRKSTGMGRMFLHARSLELTHPVTKRKVRFESSIPIDFSDLRSALHDLKTA